MMLSHVNLPSCVSADNPVVLTTGRIKDPQNMVVYVYLTASGFSTDQSLRTLSAGV